MLPRRSGLKGAGAGLQAGGGRSRSGAVARGVRGPAARGASGGDSGWCSLTEIPGVRGAVRSRGRRLGTRGSVAVSHACPTLVLTAPSRVPHQQKPPVLPQKLRVGLAEAAASRLVTPGRRTCTGTFLLHCAAGFCRRSAALG